jgi:hypothetical protein
MKYKKRAVAALLAAGVIVGTAGTTFAEGFPEEPAKCNSGRGNNSETTPETDCDPGNSGGNNNGGD